MYVIYKKTLRRLEREEEDSRRGEGKIHNANLMLLGFFLTLCFVYTQASVATAANQGIIAKEKKHVVSLCQKVRDK